MVLLVGFTVEIRHIMFISRVRQGPRDKYLPFMLQRS